MPSPIPWPLVLFVWAPAIVSSRTAAVVDVAELSASLSCYERQAFLSEGRAKTKHEVSSGDFSKTAPVIHDLYSAQDILEFSPALAVHGPYGYDEDNTKKILPDDDALEDNILPVLRENPQLLLQKKDGFFVVELPLFSVALWRQPRADFVKTLRDKVGVTHVITLLGSKAEQTKNFDLFQEFRNNFGQPWHPSSILEESDEEAVEPRGGWVHLQLAGAKSGQLTAESANIGKTVQRVLLEKNRCSKKPVVFIHCAAGLHRTGFVAHALLLSAGLTPQESLATIKLSRWVSGEEAHTPSQQRRLKLAEIMVASWGRDPAFLSDTI